MICNQCGNLIIYGCGPKCLLCEKTGRQPHEPGATELMLKAQAAALNAAYAAMLASAEERHAVATVLDAQKELAMRMQFNDHSRSDERPAWAKAKPQ